MEKEKVIICMSTYNGERFLRYQIQSILDQNYQNWELLIHDDGSTDSTQEIMRSYADYDQRIQIVSTNHLGVKGAFFSLLSVHEGDYYAFCDQDDIWRRDKLTKLLSAVDGQDEKVPLLIHSAFQNIDQNGKNISDFRHPKAVSTQFKDLLLSNNVTGCTCLFNVKLRDMIVKNYEQLNLADVIMHDWWVAILASGLGNVIYCDERLVGYRQHDSNVLGAPGRINKITRFVQSLKFGDKEMILAISRQTKMFLKIFGKYLDTQNYTIASFIAKQLDQWAPIRQLFFIKRHSLRSQSKYRNIQFIIILLLPVFIRPTRFLSHN